MIFTRPIEFGLTEARGSNEGPIALVEICAEDYWA